MDQAPGVRTSEVTGVVFCGGLSRRMGQDKALLASGGETLLEKAHGLLAPHVCKVVLSTGSSARYGDMGLDCVLDEQPDLGPIGGLQAALLSCSTPWILALACDLPRLSESQVLELLGAARKGDLAVVFGSPEHPEPLFALYHKDLLSSVSASIQAGRRRMTSFIGKPDAPTTPDTIPARCVRWLPLVPGCSEPFSNVNRPQDWQNYQRSVGATGAETDQPQN